EASCAPSHGPAGGAAATSATQDSGPSPAVERRGGGARNDEEYPCGISGSSAPRLRRQSAAGRRQRISNHAPSVPNEVRHQIRGRLDDAGCVALALGWLRARRPPHAI